VSTNNEIVIKDSCILFDLIDVGLLQDFFKLELLAYTTQQVLDEITEESQLTEIVFYINNGRLIIDSEGPYDSIAVIYDENPGLSFTDSSVIELASRKNGVILSADKSLRNEAVRRNFTVRGLLWIIEELHTKKIISFEKALESLRIYPEINKRAPKKEIDKLITKLNSIIS